MYSHQTKIKVRYGETDQMGIVYHGNYPQYLEIGRLEWLNSLGLSYKKMEASGIKMPVVTIGLKYLKSAIYDDELVVTTTLVKPPTAAIEFSYEIRNLDGDLLTTAHTKLVFINMTTNKPTRCPQYILDQLQN